MHSIHAQPDCSRFSTVADGPISTLTGEHNILAFIRGGGEILRAIAAAVEHRYEDMAADVFEKIAARDEQMITTDLSQSSLSTKERTMNIKAHAKSSNDHHSVGGDVIGMVHAGTERLNEVVGAAGEKCEELTESVMERIGDAGDKAQEAKKGVERRIREKPFKFLLIATGVGFVLGAIWRGR